ncbi:hypothetical protein DVDV_2319 [Desulfovibrio sp. DV]|uniref:hypothetical protein n=1 Tax=Desulfovibrio sp. DV TaxID=1844708 RepID=UPI00094B7A13|nr:hypothetical protein [Desulfovibrio sp. DV]OLN27019.1 hypothetical protein DVDV_2319 [Desulfovibrio sp. DV]
MPSQPDAPAPQTANAPAAKAVYWGLALALVWLFYGEFLFSDRVGILDWSKDLYYFAFLHDALNRFGRLPASFLVIPQQIEWFSTLQDLSYWSNPEVISLSPLLPLAFVLPFMAFVKTYFGLHLLAAAWGVRLLAVRLGWDTGQAVLLLVLFLGNPWLIQHLAIGYSPQISLCLVPALAACLAGRTWRCRDLAGACLLGATIFYQGALHLFVWVCLAAGCFAALLALFTRHPAALARVGAFFAGVLVLVAPKVYAVSAVYSGWQRIPGHGYQSLADLWGLLTDAEFPLFQFPETYSHCHVAFYDGSILMGPAFVVLGLWLAGELVVAVFRHGRPGLGRLGPQLAALCSAAVFLALGWGTVWRSVCESIPPLASEIYPFRFLLIALLFLFYCIVARLGPFPTSRPGRWRALGIYTLAGLACLTFYERNRQLMPSLTEQPNFIGRLSLADYYADRVTAYSSGVRLPVAATPAAVTITPAGSVGDQIELPWLPAAALGGYKLDNARPVAQVPADPQAVAVIEVTAASRQVVLWAKTHHRDILLPAAGLAFAALLPALCRLARRRPGLFSNAS